MNFTWPPDGGAPVNVFNMLSRYSNLYETTLLIPRISQVHPKYRRPWPLGNTKFFLRGEVSFREKPPFEVEFVELSWSQFCSSGVEHAIRQKLELLRPDYVFVADAWYFKPAVVRAAAAWKPVVRLYVHEMMCLKGNGILFRGGKVCEVNYLDRSAKSYLTCLGCAGTFYASYPSPRWVIEFLRSGAFLPHFRERAIGAFNSAAVVLVGNPFIANRLQPFIQTPVKVAPAGINLEQFPGKSNFSSNGVWKILALGRMEMKVKGLPILLEACRKMWKERKDFRLLVASQSDLPHDEFMEIQPWVSHEKISTVYDQAHIVVIPSLWPDILPQVGFEAMAMGLPVVGSNVGGIPNQIQDAKTGFLVSAGDVGQLVDRISWLLDHRDQAIEMGREGRKHALREFGIGHVFEKYYENLFRDYVDIPSALGKRA